MKRIERENITEVNCKYGAPMGRRDCRTEPYHPIKFHLVQLSMSPCGAYDLGGAYWGCGNPIFHAWGDANLETQEIFVRAADRKDAKQQVRNIFPNARFYR